MDYAYGDPGEMHTSHAAPIGLDGFRRSSFRNEHNTLRRGMSHGSNDNKDNEDTLNLTNENRWSGSTMRSWCNPFDDESPPDRPLTPDPPGPLLYGDELVQDINNTINELTSDSVTETSHGWTDPGGLPVRRGERLPLRISTEKHRDTVSSRSTDQSYAIPDLVSEDDHDRDSDSDQESEPEPWYRSPTAPSPFPSMTPSAEVRDAYVSLGGRVESLVGFIRKEPLSPPYSRYFERKPLPLLPPGEATDFPCLSRADRLFERSSFRSPHSRPHSEAPQIMPTSHIASQIRRRPLPPQSADFANRESSNERPLPPEETEFSSSSSSSSFSSAAPLDLWDIHPALRDQEKLRLRHLSSDSGKSTFFSSLDPPTSGCCFAKSFGECGSSQCNQPRRSDSWHRHAQSEPMEPSDSYIRQPSTTMSGLGSPTVCGLKSPTLLVLSYTRPDVGTTQDPKGHDILHTRRHSFERQLNVGGTTFDANTALEIPKLRRHDTDDSEELEEQAILDEIKDVKEKIMRGIQNKLRPMEVEEAESLYESLQNKSSTQAKNPSLSQRLGLKRLVSDARLIYSQAGMMSTSALLSNSTPAFSGDHPAIGSTLRLSRSATQSSGRRSSSRLSRELSLVVSRDNQAKMEEVVEEVGIAGAKRPKGGPLRKVFELQFKLSGHRDKDMVPTSSEKAAKLLGGAPGYAPSVKFRKRVKEAEEVVKCVEKLIG